MSNQTQPATKFDVLTDFSSDITTNAPFLYRKIFCVGGTQVVIEDKEGDERTVIAADYAAINNQAIYVKAIKAATDCTTIYASL